jgi:hypothetical protein
MARVPGWMPGRLRSGRAADLGKTLSPSAMR